MGTCYSHKLGRVPCGAKSMSFRPDAEHPEERGNNFAGLRNDEVRLVRKFWADVSYKEPQFAAKLFMNLFRTHPELRHSFDFEGIPESELWENERFKSHAANFKTFFEVIHDNLDAESEVVNQAVLVGRAHARMKIRNPDIFESTYWLLIARIALNMMMETSQDFIVKRQEKMPEIEQSIEHLWSIIFLRMILEMMNAFYDLLLKTSMTAAQIIGKTDPEPSSGRGGRKASSPMDNRRQLNGSMTRKWSSRAASFRTPPGAGEADSRSLAESLGTPAAAAPMASPRTPDPVSPWSRN